MWVLGEVFVHNDNIPSPAFFFLSSSFYHVIAHLMFKCLILFNAVSKALIISVAMWLSDAYALQRNAINKFTWHTIKCKSSFRANTEQFLYHFCLKIQLLTHLVNPDTHLKNQTTSSQRCQNPVNLIFPESSLVTLPSNYLTPEILKG